jgi:hypothetical protein
MHPGEENELEFPNDIRIGDIEMVFQDAEGDGCASELEIHEEEEKVSRGRGGGVRFLVGGRTFF